MESYDQNDLLKALYRERDSRKLTERLLEEKSYQLYIANKELRESNEYLEMLLAKRDQWIEDRENELNTLYNENPLPIIVYNLENLQIIDVNQTAIDFYGFLKSEFLQMEILSLHEPNELQILREHIDQIKNSNYTIKTWKHITKSGIKKTVKITGRSVRYGNQWARMAIIEDITDLERLRLEKEKSDKKYKLIIEKSSDIIFRISKEGYFNYVNPEGCRIIEYDLSELRKIRFDQLVCFDHVQEVIGFYQNQLANKIRNTYLEFPVLTKTGRKIWIGQSVDIAEELENEIIELTAVAREITEKKNSVEKLQRSEEKFRSIIENMELGIVEVDRSGTILKAYPSFCKIVGYEPEELEGTKGHFLLDQQGIDRMQIEQENRSVGETNVYEFELISKSGERKWVVISGAPVYNENKEIQGSIGIHLDITERKNLEKELQIAKNVAEDSLKSKELFLANISHEIRTPIHAISGLLQLLDSSNLSNSQSQYLHHIRNATENLLSLIQDLLLLTKSQLGDIQLNNDSHSLYSTLYNTFSLFIGNAKKDLKYTASIELSPDQFYEFDKLRLNQIIQNLLSNALKFTTSGEVKITSRVINSDSDYDTLNITIEDTGIGIPNHDLPRIYEKFKQGSNNDIAINGGTGLGLAIVQNLINLMDGDIEITSGYWGTKVDIHLNLKRVERKPELRGIKKVTIHQESTLNILVAEDNSVNQFLMSSYLDRLNHSYKIVPNGSEVLKSVIDSDFDLILMDVRMPVMDGLMATRELRKVYSKLELPVIGLTADDIDSNYDTYLSSGMNTIISKPIDLEVLSREIQNIVNSHEPQQNLSARLNDNLGNDKALQQMLLKIFIEDSELRLLEIRACIKANDYDKIAEIVHAMKPSIGQIGKKSTYKQILLLENFLKEGKKDDNFIERILIEIEKLLEESRDFLSQK